MREGLHALRAYGGVGLNGATDERLAQLAAKGDERAFSVLYARYGRRLYAYCRSIVSNDEDAHDALQSAMLNAYRALRRNGGGVHVRAWLFRIAHNESISLVRARRDHEILREDSWVSDDGPGERALAREELDGLVDGVLELSERRRTALVMRELSGFGYPAIASALGTSAGAAKQAVFEARSALSARRGAAGLLGPLAPLWSAFTGWLAAGIPSAAKAGAVVVALAAGTGTAEELLDEPVRPRPPVARAAAAASAPAVAIPERSPAGTAGGSRSGRRAKAAAGGRRRFARGSSPRSATAPARGSSSRPAAARGVAGRDPRRDGPEDLGEGAPAARPTNERAVPRDRTPPQGGPPGGGPRAPARRVADAPDDHRGRATFSSDGHTGPAGPRRW